MTILKHYEKVIVELILYPITSLSVIQNHFLYIIYIYNDVSLLFNKNIYYNKNNYIILVFSKLRKTGILFKFKSLKHNNICMINNYLYIEKLFFKYVI